MEALIASFLESLGGGGGGAGGMAAESALGGAPTVVDSMGTMVRPEISMSSLGDTALHFGKQAMAPTMEAYNTLTNPNSTASDMLSGAYKYAFNSKNKEDEQMMSPPQMRMGGGMGGMANNYVGGIPSLLQGYGSGSQGLLPYIGSR
tara:strand:- start:82 stop:522 length:441 start_codon:yes stop_codon:yes gene_type:complete